MEVYIGAEFGPNAVKLIDASKKNIDLCVYDWRFYPDRPMHPVSMFNQALIRAVRRGVSVRALINASTYVDHLKSVGIQARNPKTQRVMHSKFIIFDSEHLLLGSHNFTSNAFTTNFETSVFIPYCPVAPRFHQFFTNLYGI